ncbi:MAG: glycosyltransferase family 9 protein, partial [Gemmatimonadota bacterium]|nr:glycosyltransferase family 9 protein [Gemmatimonadota bacterium]
AERFATAAGVLAGRLGLKVLVLGSARDNEECGAVARMLGEKSCLNLAGKLDIRASAAAVERSCCLITNDTGLMHIATATGTPVAAVFGPTTRHLGYFPYRADKKSVVIEEKLYCRPCTHNGRKRCPLRHFRCMLDIEPERVSEAVIGLLGKN